MKARHFFIYWLLCVGCFAADAARGGDILLPQALQVTLADGTVAPAQILVSVNNSPMMLVWLPDTRVSCYYLTATNPQPVPNPTPAPVVVPQKLTIAIVEEPAKATPGQQKVITSAEFQDAAKKDHNFLGVVTPDAQDPVTKEVPASLAPFLAAAKNRKLPWIMFMSAKGEMIWEGNPPDTTAEMLALLKKYGGK